MNNKETYIKAVLVVFGLLIMSRLPGFLNGEVDGVLIVSTLVELLFFIWGVILLRK
jgi:hypothetical protein